MSFFVFHSLCCKSFATKVFFTWVLVFYEVWHTLTPLPFVIHSHSCHHHISFYALQPHVLSISFPDPLTRFTSCYTKNDPKH